MTGPYIPERHDLPISGLVPPPPTKTDKRDEVDGEAFAKALKKQRLQTDTEQRNQRKREETEEADVKAAGKKALIDPINGEQKPSVFDMETPKKRELFASNTKTPTKTSGETTLLFLPSEGLSKQEESNNLFPEIDQALPQETLTPQSTVTLTPSSPPSNKRPTAIETPSIKKAKTEETLREQSPQETVTTQTPVPLKKEDKKEVSSFPTPPLKTPIRAKKEQEKSEPLVQTKPTLRQELPTTPPSRPTTKAPLSPTPKTPETPPIQDPVSHLIPEGKPSLENSPERKTEIPAALPKTSIQEVKEKPSMTPKEVVKTQKSIPPPPATTETFGGAIATPTSKLSRNESDSKKIKAEEVTGPNGEANPLAALSGADDSTEDNKKGKDEEEDLTPILLKAPPVAFSSALQGSSFTQSTIGSFPPDVLLMFERISGITMVLGSRSKWPGDSETTFVIDEAILREAKLSSSVFLGCEITIITSAGAPNSFNVRLSGNPEAKQLFAEHKDKLEKAFKEKKFDVHIIETNIQL